MYNDITGIILAGGKSSRMGVNKALLIMNGKSIIEHIVLLFKSIFGRVMLVTNNPDDYLFPGIEIFGDVYPGMGPLAGIHSGLVHSDTEKNFVISCDIPLINKEIIEYIIEFRTIHPITVVKAEGYIQQLCGIYNKSLALTADKILIDNQTIENGSSKPKCKVMSLIDAAGAEIIESNNIPCYTEGLFLNVNKPDDYLMLLGKV